MKTTSRIRNEGKNIVYYLNEKKQSLPKPLIEAIRQYGIEKFDAGIRHQKQETLRVLGVNDDADSWI